MEKWKMLAKPKIYNIKSQPYPKRIAEIWEKDISLRLSLCKKLAHANLQNLAHPQNKTRL